MTETIHRRWCDKPHFGFKKKMSPLYKHETEMLQFAIFACRQMIKHNIDALCLKPNSTKIIHSCASASRLKRMLKESVHSMFVFMSLDMRSLTLSIFFSFYWNLLDNQRHKMRRTECGFVFQFKWQKKKKKLVQTNHLDVCCRRKCTAPIYSASTTMWTRSQSMPSVPSCSCPA